MGGRDKDRGGEESVGKDEEEEEEERGGGTFSIVLSLLAVEEKIC